VSTSPQLYIFNYYSKQIVSIENALIQNRLRSQKDQQLSGQ